MAVGVDAVVVEEAAAGRGHHDRVDHQGRQVAGRGPVGHQARRWPTVASMPVLMAATGEVVEHRVDLGVDDVGRHRVDGGDLGACSGR